MIRDAYRKRRCVVPMNSFFQKDRNGKRYAVSRRDGEVFGVAGIWENWRGPLTSTWECTFPVITVPASALIAPIHDRMLAILPNEHFPRWLGDEADPRDLLVPFPSISLRSPAAVATLVWKPESACRLYRAMSAFRGNPEVTRTSSDRRE
jgi:putative SOS response-associated peptidase YedK